MDKHEDAAKCILDGMVKEMKQPSVDNIPPITFGDILAAGINLSGAGMYFYEQVFLLG